MSEAPPPLLWCSLPPLIYRYYGALVEVLSGDGATASVRFDGYGTTIFVRLSELRPLTWKEEPADKQTKKVVKPNAK